MIDFRYHLVSLISVFLALAVGIVLGAGPLREGISDTLTGQVQELRTDRDNLRKDLDKTQREVTGRGDVLGAVQNEAVTGLLAGQKVTIVTLPGAGDIDAVSAALTQAGAEVVAHSTVSDAIVNPDTAAFRSSFASQLTGYLAKQPAADATTEEILGQALAQSFAKGKQGNENAATLHEFLTKNDPPFVTVVAEASHKPTAAVVIGPPHTQVKAEDAAKVREADLAYARLAQGIADVMPTVLVGSATADTDLVSVLRASALVETMTAVDSVGTPVASINVPRALAAAITGTKGQYGIETGAASPLAPHTPVPSEPAPSESPTGGE
ncbi:hypothetical protein BSZ39_02230 [Bowdeniella nasicola]|uniref:Copper transport outer membrane protein, MctB n=1 Tax=Bowdeniella nasicola TaxID=208480 RepID=A0A1Q5Q4R1_9ACTO|nr:copper transporter [Bowdeniella nasicola]OKL54815.1 hypothetical protein BSZ39_02230 [Bowdeniella nasicola]